MALKTQTLPARINTAHAIEGLMANVAPSRKADLRTALVLSTGMGGQNAAIVLQAV
jgi:3-oxoacyl-(acyl-carrier-protein) synthase